jgi:hypothetical protein
MHMPSWALVLQVFLPASDVTISKVALSLVIMRGRGLKFREISRARRGRSVNTLIR